MNKREKLESIFRSAMEKKKVLPVRAGNMKTLKWLEKRGCIASWEGRYGIRWHPMAPLEAHGYKNGLQQHFTLQGIFRIRGGDNGSRRPPPPFEWLEEGTMIEIRCRLKKKDFLRRPERITVWVPNELADKALVLGMIP